MKHAGFFSRWQECLVWLPVLVMLALVGWIVFGALDQRITSDALAWLLELPILCAHFAAGCAAAWMFKQTYLRADGAAGGVRAAGQHRADVDR
jgi:hypothetical protein